MNKKTQTRRSGVNINQIAEALRASGGFQSQAGKMVGITQSGISRRIAASTKLQKVVREISEYYLDMAESQLIKAVKSGEPWAICFYLKCKGKSRGYIERQELSGPEGLPLPIELVRRKD